MSEFFEPILAACAPIAELDVALDAELAVSALLGGAYAAADTDRDAAVARFASDLIDVLVARDDRLSGALLAGLAGVAPPAAAERAAAGLAAAAERPTWSDEVGTARCTGGWAMSDMFGDQTEYILPFEYPDAKRGGRPHAVCVLVDFNAGAVKDCWISLDPERILADCRRSAASDEDLMLGEVEPATVRATVGAMFAVTDGLPELPASEGLSEERRAVLSRLATLPAIDLAPVTVGEVAADFLAAPEAAVDGAPADIVAACTRLIAEYAVAESRADPLRWSPITVEMFLTEWAPRAAVVDEDSVRWLPTVLGAFISYAGRRSDRPTRAISATWDAIAEHTGYFVDAMTGADSEQTTAAQVARQLIADGIDPTDQDAVRRWLDAKLRPRS